MARRNYVSSGIRSPIASLPDGAFVVVDDETTTYVALVVGHLTAKPTADMCPQSSSYELSISGVCSSCDDQ